ncbi:MAG: alpha/beta hydrolase [candidate division Zixibacteria bacterium]|nr:alpha/beta hydrolase [candidate division Zixibacteria bacterium]
MNLRKLSIGLTLILALAGSLLISCQQKAETDPVAVGSVVDSVASADGVMIHYEVSGKGEPALVFVHGWSCDRSYWKNQVDEFDKTFMVVTVDMGGHGGSGLEREDWTLPAFGADVAAVVNKLNPAKVVLIGHSMAGAVNMNAMKHLTGRVVGLIGVDTYQEFGPGAPPEQVVEFMTPFRTNFAIAMDGFVRAMFPKNADSALVNMIVSDMSSAPPEVAISAIENYFNSNTLAILKETIVPIRAINSDLWPTDLETNQENAVSYELKLMSGFGHFIMQEDPVTFNQLLHETLDELTGISGVSVENE